MDQLTVSSTPGKIFKENRSFSLLHIAILLNRLFKVLSELDFGYEYATLWFRKFI